MAWKKKQNKKRTYKPTIEMKYSELRKSEYVPEIVFDPWASYSDGLQEFKDRTIIRNPHSWSLKMEAEDIKKYNEKNKRLAKRRKRRQKINNFKKGETK